MAARRTVGLWAVLQFMVPPAAELTGLQEVERIIGRQQAVVAVTVHPRRAEAATAATVPRHPAAEGHTDIGHHRLRAAATTQAAPPQWVP